jgi:hypothetical protein
MDWQAVVVGLIVGGAVVYLLRRQHLTRQGKASVCGNCDTCTTCADEPQAQSHAERTATPRRDLGL